MFLTTIRLWKFRNPKTKRDNAFQYVVLRLAGSSSRRVAVSGQMRLQKYKFYSKQGNMFGIICKYQNKFVTLQQLLRKFANFLIILSAAPFGVIDDDSTSVWDKKAA